jgi:phage minor structural protein GP20
MGFMHLRHNNTSDSDHLKSLVERRKTMTKEELQAIGLTDEQVQEVFKLRGSEVNELKDKISILETEKANLNTQIETANAQIKAFNEMDIDAIKQNLQNYETKYNDLKIQSEKDINNLKFNHSLDLALNNAKVKNLKAVKALLDIENLSTSKNIDTDLEQAIANLKETDSYLFLEEQPQGAAVAKGATLPQNKSIAEMSYEDFLKLEKGI